ncbi:uncharacterized protein CTRU02_212188 [Colletotrichum truncatum]|uniref:Uncharacterized protein n=1 Tax=Colletotrichum truncatum TaxID=5467 RepID=A0ACC3YMU7_COLTU|nr:uncharacterized protein CTRU02_06741 [Colletotrichum truncatum]KAF6792124.1 hypothetical protein CTRU02_06741 [Colletotrichum truncatum]
MESSHYHHQAMFTPGFPAVPVPAQQSAIPAKREDDDVQFLSSNPVKKRKIDCCQSIMPPLTATSTTSPPARHPIPAPVSTHRPLEPAKQTTATTQPERRGSTGMVDPSATAQMMDVDPMRGCSMPIPERSGYPDSFWTAPSTGPRSSPPVSPKSLPEHAQPSMIRLEEVYRSTPQSISGINGGAVTDSFGFSGVAHTASNPAHVSQLPIAVKAEGTPLQLNSEDQIQTETSKDTQLVDAIPEQTGATANIDNNSVEAHVHTKGNAATEHSWQQQQHPIRIVVMDGQSCAPADLQLDMGIPMLNFESSHSSENSPSNHQQPQTHNIPQSSGGTPLAHVPSQPPNHSTISVQADACGNRPPSGAKGPCRQCLEARLRQQAANQAASMSTVAGLPLGSKVPGPGQTSIPPSTVLQPWTQLLGINPYYNPMAGALYGPSLQQPLMAGTNGHLAVPSQNYPSHGLLSQQTNAHKVSLAPAPSMPSIQPFVSNQKNPQPAKTASIAPSTQISKTPDIQLTTKHIIVDIADTCLDLFPFDAVAKRHNQPEQKVRDIFSAIIQVPLLRCNTDKRRAGKLGTARVKEFNQAKKDVQIQASTSQTKQDAMNQTPYMPTAWQMAQFMGPSDVRLAALPQYSGPW